MDNQLISRSYTLRSDQQEWLEDRSRARGGAINASFEMRLIIDEAMQEEKK